MDEQWKPIKEGDELLSIPSNPWCDGCDGTEWEATEDGGRRCTSCGETYTLKTYRERELRPDEGYVRIQREVEVREATGDERPIVTISTGPDDQRPDHDPEAGIYRPFNVKQQMYPKGKYEDSFYTYLEYCGNCRHKWDSAYDWLLCPYCGVTIGNYIFAHGLGRVFPPPDRSLFDPENPWPPEELPEGAEFDSPES